MAGHSVLQLYKQQQAKGSEGCLFCRPRRLAQGTGRAVRCYVARSEWKVQEKTALSLTGFGKNVGTECLHGQCHMRMRGHVHVML